MWKPCPAHGRLRKWFNFKARPTGLLPWPSDPSVMCSRPEGFRAPCACGNSEARPENGLSSKPTRRASGVWPSLRINGRWPGASVFKGHKGDITGVAFSPDGKTLASASCDGTVRLWKRGGFWSKEKTVLEGKWGGVQTVAFAPLAPVLAFGCQDQTVRLFALDGNSYQEAAVLRGHSGAVRLVMFPLEGKNLISICERGVAILWDLASGAESYRWSLGELGPPTPGSGSSGLAMTPDGRYVAIGSPEGGVTLWRLFSKKSK